MLRKRHLKNGLLVVFLFSLHCSARIIIVTDTNDTTKVTSLRGAILEANRHRGQNTIILGRDPNPRHHSGVWVYRLTIPGADETAGLKGDLNITRGELTIMGASSNVTIDATGLGDRVFDVSVGARVTLENLIITGGKPPANTKLFGSGEYGGAILNSGTLFLENCIISNNFAGDGKQNLEGNSPGPEGGEGGAIFNFGILWVSNCAIVGNASGAGFNAGFGGDGGGIRNYGYCLLNNSIISGNEAGSGGNPAGNEAGLGGPGGNGGGIFNSGTMILEQCIVAANNAGQGASGAVSPLGFGGWGGNGGNGGGIYNVGNLEIDFSTIYGNNTGGGGNGASASYAGNPGYGGNGGGIFNAGNLNLNTSTISSNSCANGGNGGDSLLFGSGPSGAAGGSGGGIYNSETNEFWMLSTGTVELASSTITLNMCGAGGNAGNGFYLLLVDQTTSPPSGGSGGSGGGIMNGAAPDSILLLNSLIAQNLVNAGGAGGTNISGGFIIIGQPPPPPQIGNPGTNGTGFDLAGNFTSQGFNLISTGDGSTGFVVGIHADQVGSDANPIEPLLGPLQFNGGPTPTHALLWGSPAIDQGNSFGVHTDQRGSHRPFIYSSITKPPGGDGSDIGAFELNTQPNP